MYYTGSAANAAGALLTEIIAKLTANGWTDAGSPASNKRVFTSPGLSTEDLIVIEIDDSHAAYTAFRAGTAYDDGTKILSNPTTVRYLLKASSFPTVYWLIVDADRFILSSKCLRTGTNNYDTIYCGLPLRYDTSDIYTIICTGATATAVPQGILHSTVLTGNLGQILKDYAGQLNKTFGACALNTCFGDGQLPNPIDGKMIISPIIIGSATSAIIGELKGLFSLMGSAIAPEDILTKDADEYLCMLTGTYKIAMLK